MTSKDPMADLLRILSGPRLAFLAFIVAGGYFLWTEHQAHLFAALPYLIVLVCPLLHIFMHRDHGNHQKGDKTHTHGDHAQGRDES
jgi:hypothetical protein